MLWAYVIIGLVALQRLFELVYANHNTRALMARGAVEIGRAHYPMLIAVHVAWFVAIVAFLGHPPVINWYLIALMLLLQLGRLWVLVTLGPYWTTRIITLPAAPLVKKGPYRFISHPNYAVVIAEIACLPAAFGEWKTMIVFSILNAAVLILRIRQEELALNPRRALAGQ
ncbi:MAG TPA: isoprenylcysteine carboxylmethyltransferase family protein [Rhizomicrobium sp.]|jgi:methyltransferase|nr:isoprenylcysteine carboxylmethyltransferase family protein [Rhizomicrobium sp.]